MVDAVSGASSGSNSASQQVASAAQTEFTADFNFFLKMMTTQLQNQDPTDPMDTNEYTQQLVQYSQVEQQIQTNEKLDSMVSLLGGGNGSVAYLNYIGKEVEVPGDTISLSNSQSVFKYSLAAPASTVEIDIKDANGNVVASYAGETTQGDHFAVWDGTNADGSTKSPDGQYTVTVTAKDSSGQAVTNSTAYIGVVSGVETASDGSTSLTVGGMQVDPSTIDAVRAPGNYVAGDGSGDDSSGDGSGDGSADSGDGNNSAAAA